LAGPPDLFFRADKDPNALAGWICLKGSRLSLSVGDITSEGLEKSYDYSAA
jgi:hypothetical protein